MSKPARAIDSNSVLLYPRTLFTQEHEAFRKKFREFIKTELKPHIAEWQQKGMVNPETFRKALEQGYYVSTNIPKKYGGYGYDFRYNVLIQEELEAADCGDIFFPLGTDIVLPYFTHIATEEQKQKWLPRIVKERLIIAVAMSEPDVGSDLQAVGTTAVKDPKTGEWILNGRKMWISSGAIADLVVVVAYTDKSKGSKGMSLFVVEKGTPGYSVFKVIKKLGRHAQDTAILRFNNVRIPADNLLGVEGQGFKNLMTNLPQERLSIATASLATSRRVLSLTMNYVQNRELFKRVVGDFQHVSFTLAQLATELNLAQLAIDRIVELHLKGECTTELASMAKVHATELTSRVCDKCLQFFGGYGYVESSPVGRAYVDNRVTRIYGGANEIMTEIVARIYGFRRAPPPPKMDSELGPSQL